MDSSPVMLHKQDDLKYQFYSLKYYFFLYPNDQVLLASTLMYDKNHHWYRQYVPNHNIPKLRINQEKFRRNYFLKLTG